MLIRIKDTNGKFLYNGKNTEEKQINSIVDMVSKLPETYLSTILKDEKSLNAIQQDINKTQLDNFKNLGFLQENTSDDDLKREIFNQTDYRLKIIETLLKSKKITKFNSAIKLKVIEILNIIDCINFTNPARLKHVVGAIKVKSEIPREILSNAVDAGASNINIACEYISNNKVTLKMEYFGNKLIPFENIFDLLKCLLVPDISNKRNNPNFNGEFGLGLKSVLSSETLEITFNSLDELIKLRINNPKKQLEEFYNNEREIFDIEIFDIEKIEFPIENNLNTVKFVLKSLSTNNLRAFEHKSLIQYLRYFSVLGPLKYKDLKEKNISINVKGLILDSKDSNNIHTKDIYESLDLINIFDSIKDFGIEEHCKFHYLECLNDEIYSNSSITEEDKQILQNFFRDKGCYLFRTTDSKLKSKMNVNRLKGNKFKQGAVSDEEFHGIYPASNGIIINDKFFDLLKTNGGKKSGGNLFSQYLGYISCNYLSPTADRNSIEANDAYYKFLGELVTIMPIINKVLNTDDLVDYNHKKKLYLGDDNTIQGLWGELKFIHDNPEYLQYWVIANHDSTNQIPNDFVNEDGFKEIKTKKIGSDRLIHINCVEQLNIEEKGELHIYYLNRYENTSSQDGQNIIELINDILDVIGDDYKETLFIGIQNYLKIDRFNAIYSDITENKYDLNSLYKYSVAKIEIYDVNSSFIKIPISEYEEYKSKGIIIPSYLLNLDTLNDKGILPRDTK